MLKKATLLGFLFVFMTGVYAQDELNPYKYIIIPKKYDFLKRENQYRVNTYTKYLFDNEGFTTVLQGESYPNDLMSNPCIGVTADVEDGSNMFTTKLKLVLKDCHGNIVFTTVQGTSKLKEYDKTYIDALKKSFVSIEQLNYNFDPTIKGKSDAAAQKMPVAEVKQVKEEVAETEIAAAPVVVPEKAAPEVAAPANQTVAAPVVAAVAVPVVTESKEPEKKAETTSTGTIARNYKNENISFFLIEQGDKLVAYVNESKNENYKKGELIGTFEKTSLPNVFRVEWKKKEQDIDETTAYFDDSGNLKIDIHRNGKIEVISFSEVK